MGLEADSVEKVQKLAYLIRFSEKYLTKGRAKGKNTS